MAGAVAASRQLAGFIAKFDPPMQRLIRAARKRMRALLPTATELVYDNYNFLVIGYGPGPRASEAIFSLAAYARGLTLFFLQGKGLPDPASLLRGSGNVVRSIRLETAKTVDRPEIQALLSAALARAKVPLPRDGKHELLIKSVSAKQRPRRVPARG
jgi:hypothetical protein